MSQLSKKKKIAGLLSVATCTLLGNPVQADERPWDIDTAILFYSESNSRIEVVEPVISAKKELNDEEYLSLKLVVDTLTGASATGAVPSSQVQTFTRPSGSGSYTVAPGETPLDDTFKDTRVSFGMNWEKPIDRNNRRNLGFNVSQEYDFTSIAVSGQWQHDINQRNTTFTTGVNIELDNLDPVGGAPEPLSDMLAQNKMSSDESREVFDILFGVTQVIDRSSLFQLNLTLSESDGYLTDPYKFVSIVDGTGEPINQLFESRPDSRSRQGIFAKYRKMFENKNIFTASYRFMTDDWGVDSNTFDFNYRFKLGGGYFVRPRYRFYQQSEADFYRYFLRDGEAVPDEVSADYRLGEMDATTVGVKFGHDIDNRHSWSVRLEQYVQSGESSPSEAFGQLVQQDLYPDVEATIVQFNYSFQF
jgi:hypothetical protein